MLLSMLLRLAVEHLGPEEAQIDCWIEGTAERTVSSMEECRFEGMAWKWFDRKRFGIVLKSERGKCSSGGTYAG